MRKNRLLSFVFIGAVTFPVALAHATENTSGVTWGAFVDAYYAYDFDRPNLLDRAYTTQPARHNEFNLNLVYVEAKLERERTHGRLALQAGTSVQSNYAGEATRGTVSGPSLSRNIQEGFIGYRLGENTWVDGGILLSHIGLESFISKDNLIYTRSLVADYSPYYETGVRFTTKFNDSWSGQLLILNGWQNISETNESKALGTQLNFTPSATLSFTYNTFFGREASFRQFHDLIIKYSPTEVWSYALQADIGFQDEAALGHDASWDGFALIAKRMISKSIGLVSRVEYYSDPKLVLVSTPGGTPFRAWSGSLGVDATLDANVWWRNEVRGYWADQAVFPSNEGFKKNDGVIVSSISAAF